MEQLLVKIDSLVRISGGILLTKPSIDSITEIKTSPLKIKRGDMFLDINSSKQEIEIAVENGAYCILTAMKVAISDEEIGWIYVKSFDAACVKLARYFATLKSFRFVPLLDVQYALAKSLHVDESVRLLSSCSSEALMQIIKSEDGTLFFVVESSFIGSVDPTVREFSSKIEPTWMFESGLFFVSFVYKDRFFKDIRLSSFFVPYLCSLMECLEHLGVSFSVGSFSTLEHFDPQFVTSKLEMSEFGTTRRAVIFESDLGLYEEELEYLYSRVGREFILKSVNELRSKEFRYALLQGRREDFPELIVEKKTVQMGLF